MKCRWRRCSNEVIGGRKILFCCKLCAIKQHTVERRQKNKRRAVEFLGGKCVRCGYDKCLRALEFHHTNPEDKKFCISNRSTKAWYKIEAELSKCILLCSNCHAEEEEKINLGG